MGPTDGEIKEAREIGISRGWGHANYVTAYGHDNISEEPDYPGWLRLNSVLRKVFEDAWKEGIELYRANRYPDGTSMDEE